MSNEKRTKVSSSKNKPRGSIFENFLSLTNNPLLFIFPKTNLLRNTLDIHSLICRILIRQPWFARRALFSKLINLRQATLHLHFVSGNVRNIAVDVFGVLS